MSEPNEKQIEDAVRDITDAFGYFSPGFMHGESGRTYNDRKMSVQTFRKDDGPQGYSVLVIAPDESRQIVYLRKPGAKTPEVHRPGLWTDYLSELRAEALSVPERKRRWDLTRQTAQGSDHGPIDDSAIFGKYDSPPPDDAGPERLAPEGPLELLTTSPECHFYSRARDSEPTEETQ